MRKSLAIRISILLWFQITKDKIKPFLNWKFLISWSCAWMVTNGWSYVFIILGTALKITWMSRVGLIYYAFLWLPCTPEKLITIPLAIWFHVRFFPKDFKNLSSMKRMLSKEKKL